MKKYKAVTLMLLIIQLILEILPYGAVCIFANPEGESIIKTYPYFSLIPYGYANFGPFLTCAVTLCALIISILRVFRETATINKVCIYLNFTGLLVSLLPLTLGTEFFTLTGALISLIFAVNGIINIHLRRKQPR